MANEQNTVVSTPVPVGWDTTDFHAFQKMVKDPDASNAATELWKKETAAPVEGEEPAIETEVEPAATDPIASETEEETETEDEEGDEEESADPEAVLPKKKSGYRRKIDKLERKIAALEAAQAQPKAGEAAEPAAAKRKGPPKLSEFDYDEEKHAVAMAEYFRSSIADEQKSLRLQDEHKGRVAAYADSETAVRKTHADYDEVMESVADLTFGPVAAFALTNSDKKAELAYAIAKDATLAKQIHALSVSSDPVDHLKATRLIGLVEGKLISSETSKTEATRQPVVSKAPPPGKPITARAGAATRTAAQVLDEYSSTGDMTKANKLAAEYEKLTGKKLVGQN